MISTAGRSFAAEVAIDTRQAKCDFIGRNHQEALQQAVEVSTGSFGASGEKTCIAQHSFFKSAVGSAPQVLIQAAMSSRFTSSESTTAQELRYQVNLLLK